MKNRRVVVTGLGLITPLGLSVTQTWDAVLAGKSGITKITKFDATNSSVKIAAEVKDFDATCYLDPKEVRKLDVFIQYAMAAVIQAIKDAGLEITESLSERTGVIIGAGIGGLPLIEKNHSSYLNSGFRKISPLFIPSSIINMASGYASIKLGLKGPSYSVVSACATGSHSIGDAARMVSYGDADVMIAGGTEMATTPLGIGGFASARALSRRNDEPQKASRPWDKDRDGFVLGEGAGILILEEYDFAKKRGANIYAELIGFGMSSDAFHITAVDETAKGPMKAMESALADGQINPNEVDYINAHGTSTVLGDPLEVLAIKNVFGDHAYNLAVSSTKSMLGHLLGATGAVEAILSILALRDQVAPPTINLDNPDDGCDLNFVPLTPQQRKINTVLSNSFGFGGTNSSLLFSKV